LAQKRSVIFFVIYIVIGSISQAANLDSLKTIVKEQPQNESSILELLDALNKQSKSIELDSLSFHYLSTPNYSDSFYAHAKNYFAQAALRSGYEYSVILKRFRAVLNDTTHFGLDHDKGKVCHFLGSLYRNVRNNDSASHFYSLGLEYYKKAKNEYASNQIQSDLAMIFYESGQSAKALQLLNSMKTDAVATFRSRDLEIYFLKLGNVYSSLGLEDSAITTALKAIEYIDSNNYESRLAINYMNIANYLRNTSKHKESLFYAQKSLRLTKKSEDLRNIAFNYIAIARAHEGLNSFDSAIYYNKKAIIANGDHGNDIAYGNLAICFNQINELDSCIYYNNKSLKEKRKLKTDLGKISCYLSIANAHISKENDALAKMYLDSALILLNVYNDFRHYRWYYSSLMKYYIFQNEPEKAINAGVLKEQYSDSLLTQERDARIDGLRILHEAELQQNKINALSQEKVINELQLSKEKAKAKNQAKVIMFSSVLLVFLVLGFVVQRRYANRFKDLNEQLVDSNSTIKAKNEQLDLVNKEIYHRTKNHMQTVASLLGLQKDRISDSQTKDVLAENELRLNAMSLIHKKLFKQDPFAQISLQDFATELMEDLKFAYNASTNFTYHIDLTQVVVKSDTLIPLSLVINECFTNAFKYAFTNHKQPVLKATAQKDENGYTITIQDNGSGFANLEANNEPAGFGLELIKNMAIQLDGHATFQNQNGATITFSFQG
jgi:two-component sensor histidine kinase